MSKLGELVSASFAWPGMSAKIKEYIAIVKYAGSAQPMQPKETLMSHEPTHRPSDRPWEQAAVDIYISLMEKTILSPWRTSLTSGKVTGSEIPMHPHVYES